MDEHKTVIAVDIVGFGGKERTRANLARIREGLLRTVKQAFKEADIPWSDCSPEIVGDSILFLAPATVGKGHFAAMLPGALDSALRQHNEECPAEEKIRLRLVLHAGEVTVLEHGAAATAIILASRLLDAPPLKTAMAESAAVLGMIASNWFYDDVIRHRPEYQPKAYRKVTVTVKETTDIGWIRLVGDEVSAGAIEQVTNGVAVLTTLVLPSTPQFYRVVDALGDIPSMQDEHSRSLVLEQLSFAGSIPYFGTRKTHLVSILRTCLHYEDGIDQLYAAVTNLESPESFPVRRLLKLLRGEAQ